MSARDLIEKTYKRVHLYTCTGFGKRTILFLLVDIILVSLSIYIAFLLRFDGQIPPQYLGKLWIFIGIAILVKIPIFYLQRLYHMSWAYVSIQELVSVFKGISYSSLLLGTILFIFHRSIFAAFPRSILFIDYFLMLFGIGGFRAAGRVYREFLARLPSEGERVLIVGAGDAGEQILRNMLHDRSSSYLPVGFVDDAPTKQGISIHGIRVLGNRKDIPRLIASLEVQSILIAMPSAPSKIIKETVELARQAKIEKIKILPYLSQLYSGKLSLADAREVQLEDLLGREPVVIDTKRIEDYLKEKIILVTGAGGSIGGELCRQIAKFSPKRLILLDQDETGLFTISDELKERFSQLALASIVGNIRDKTKVERICAQFKPEVIFHAAAYKHVPVMEAHPDEAVKNNITGTAVIGEAAVKHGAHKFVLISTDKAVNPTSVMGATKRVAELVILNLNKRGPTKFVAVRFGNVLGSRGSVIPIFKEQIKRRGPVTVTHPEMKRYFMITSEAALLVLQAGAMGEGGEIFVLDMGEPVKIIDLAKELIKFSGLEPDKDIPIVFTGPRPGEKLFEDILTAEEGTIVTAHEKIFTAKMSSYLNEDRLFKYLERLEELADRGESEEIIELLQEMIPNYKYKPYGA